MSKGSDSPTFLAVGAHPLWPVTNGYSLRASRLIRELAQHRRVVYAGPLGDTAMSDLERALGVARVVPVSQFRGWDSQITADDRAAMFATLDRVIAEEQPRAAVVWPGAEVLLEHPRFPHRVLDRMDSEVVMAWRDVRYASGAKNTLRAVRNLALWTRHERALVRSASAITVDASVDANTMRRVSGRSSVHVVASGVDVQPLAAGSDEAAVPTVAFTGALNYSANVDAVRWFAQHVWPSVRAQLPNARFVIAGRSPSPDVIALGGNAGVEVRGDVADMWAVLRESWLTICPVRTGSGIRTKVLEAWAVGRPTVLSSVGATGLSRTADVSSLIADQPTPTAALVARLLTDSAERRRLGAALHALVQREHNGWSRAGERLCSLLDDAARA